MTPPNVTHPRAPRTQRRSAEPFAGLDRSGMPADLESAQTNILRRFSPRRNRWPEIQELDARAHELETRQAAITRDLAELEQRRLAAPARDTEALAAWQLDSGGGARPEPTLPAIEEQMKELREDFDALTAATTVVLAEKATFVEKHRPRLVQEADRAAQEKHARLVALIDELAEAREELADLRQAAVWASVYPDPAAGAQLPRALIAGGLAEPAHEAVGMAVQLQAAAILKLLRADAAFLCNASTAQQRQAQGLVPAPDFDLNATWLATPEGRAAEAKSNADARAQYKRIWGREPQ